MLIFPAIDLRDGKCVRLVEGRLDQETIYSDQPIEMALHWQNAGAKYLHVVDLDGAFAGAPKNLSVIKDIVSALDIPVQVGGGIRNLETIELLLAAGVSRVILGTAAINHPEMIQTAVRQYGEEQIVVGIDARDGRVAVHGWAVESRMPALDLAYDMVEIGVRRIVFTDISRDGTMKGPNLEATGAMARATKLKVIASGGVSTLADLKEIKALEPDGVEGVIMGKALYSGAVDIKEALTLAEG
ncbi:1-(5-phosphoribosyl)-5-[(5-phosphoribosylamino)methylideneamino]imidazole-4-carboxamide isomerase [Peptococcaceae bacterium 1198_IL3148]